MASTIAMNTVMTNQGLLTHHNGAWFDGISFLNPNPPQWLVHSFSVDVWFKFYDICNGTLIESTFYNCENQQNCNNSTLPGQWILWFDPPNNITFQLNMNTINTTFNYNPAIDKNKWMIAQASAVKLDQEGRICVKVNEENIACNNIAEYLDDTPANGTQQNIVIGNGFKGYIRKIKVYDWPKNDESMKLMYRTAPACYKFHHTQTECEI